MIQYHTYTYTHKCVDDLSKRMVTWHLFVALKHSVTRFYEYIEKLSAYYHIIDIYIYIDMIIRLRLHGVICVLRDVQTFL